MQYLRPKRMEFGVLCSIEMTGRSVTFAGLFELGSAERSIVDGLRSSGWAVDEVDLLRFFPNGDSFARKVERRFRRFMDTAAYNEAVMASIRTNNSQVLLTMKGSALSSKTLAAARKHGTLTVNYWPDYLIPPGVEYALPQYDLVLTTKEFQVETFGAWLAPSRVALVHHGYAPASHRPIAIPSSDEGFSVDVLFVGNHSPWKEQVLTAVARSLPDCSMRILGHRWHIIDDDSPLRDFVVGRAVTADFMAREVGKARINLAVHMGKDPRYGWEDAVSMRSFELPACGGFMLHIDNPVIRQLYDAGEEIGVFSDHDDLVRKIRHYLAEPDKRMSMAAAGYARAVPAYSYHERGREIVLHVEQRLAADR